MTTNGAKRRMPSRTGDPATGDFSDAKVIKNARRRAG